MRLKALGTAAIVVAALTGGFSAAEAKTSVHIGIGLGAPDYYDPYDTPEYAYPRVRYGIGCDAARDVLREFGYYRVRARDCGGRTYRFLAMKRGIPFEVGVSARSGRIIWQRPL